MKENLAKIIGIVFMSRTYAHQAHLKTESYATHKALDEFYTEVVDKIDSFAESVQGTTGILDIPYIGELQGDVLQPAEGLKQHLLEITELMKDVEIGYIVNKFEDLQDLYATTLYKLNNLK